MRSDKTLRLTQGAAIAAAYVILTFISNAFSLASGVIQVRISEALCILPFFTPAAIPGLFVGCLLSNLLTGCALLDVVFGSLATLAGALGTWQIGSFIKSRQHADNRRFSLMNLLLPLPPVIANTLTVPFVLAYVYGFEGSVPYFMLTVGIGELISCGLIGMLLFPFFDKNKELLFR